MAFPGPTTWGLGWRGSFRGPTFRAFGPPGLPGRGLCDLPGGHGPGLHRRGAHFGIGLRYYPSGREAFTPFLTRSAASACTCPSLPADLWSRPWPTRGGLRPLAWRLGLLGLWGPLARPWGPRLPGGRLLRPGDGLPAGGCLGGLPLLGLPLPFGRRGGGAAPPSDPLPGFGGAGLGRLLWPRG